MLDKSKKTKRNRSQIIKMPTNSERRKHPRIDQELPLRVEANGFDFKTSTQNVSCTGTYCTIQKYIPPFTKIAIKMTLPIVSKGVKEEIDVACKGVIVRTDDANNGGFNIAVFFNEIKEIQKKRIAQYIKQFLPKASCSQCN
jgi:hypothetical protein